MIRLNSPYYVTIPWVSPATGLTCTDYTLALFVWTGAKASPPGTAAYEITKLNDQGLTGNDKIDIAQLIRDEIEVAPQIAITTSINDGVNRVWVKWQYTYTTTNPTDGTTPQGATTKPAGLGYSFGLDGENVEDSEQKFFLTATDQKINRSGFFAVPVYCSETLQTDVEIVSYPNNEINTTLSRAATTQSDEITQIVWIRGADAPTDKYITVTVGVQSKNIFIDDEYKYTPSTFVFLNRFGAESTVTFFKDSLSRTNVESQVFQSRFAQPATGSHQYQTFKKTGRRTTRYFSGWVNENAVEEFEQMLLSQYVWKVTAGGDAEPVEVVTSSIDNLTRENEQFIQFEIEIRDAYQLINNV